MQPRSREVTKKRTITSTKTFSSSCLRVFVACALLPGWPRDINGQADRAEIERGRQIFMRVGCYQCHGREAQGASTGPRLGPDPLPLASFTRAIRTPRNDMPPYSTKILSDAELADVYAFVTARPLPRR
jgi:mono/diheme cytochrome c family protein